VTATIIRFSHLLRRAGQQGPEESAGPARARRKMLSPRNWIRTENPKDVDRTIHTEGVVCQPSRNSSAKETESAIVSIDKGKPARQESSFVIEQRGKSRLSRKNSEARVACRERAVDERWTE
jgi:hypothetical protein